MELQGVTLVWPSSPPQHLFPQQLSLFPGLIKVSPPSNSFSVLNCKYPWKRSYGSWALYTPWLHSSCLWSNDIIFICHTDFSYTEVTAQLHVACGKFRGWQFIGNKCEVESYREGSHSLKLWSVLVYICHTRCGGSPADRCSEGIKSHTGFGTNTDGQSIN